MERFSKSHSFLSSMGLPILTIMFSAAMTGAGGGIIRDILAQQKPHVFRKEVYLVWSMIAGFIIGMGWAEKPYQLYTLFLYYPNFACHVISV